MIRELTSRRLVICCGTGGVGKTTISAAVALRLAQTGARTVVVTIDPARRLASALGMTGLSDAPRRVPAESFLGPGGAELWALQLDAKATFDRLVGRYAANDAARERILENRIYRHLSGAVAGAQEYMAVERLHELVEEERFDHIVLDTPPATNALDFLDAPQRITRFIEGRALRLLLRPGAVAGGIGWKILHAGSGTVLSILERLTGAQLLRDVSDFLAGFDGMYQGFADRAQAVRALLTSDRSGFLVVAAAEPDSLGQAVALSRRLRTDGFPLSGVVLNRVHPLPPGDPPDPEALARALAEAGARDPERLARDAAAARGVGHRDEVLNADGPATSDPAVLAAIEESCAEAELVSTRMVSRAYHDAVFMARICPTAMIFVPSAGGISHRPDEYTSPQDVARGAQVLAGALARLAA